MLKRLNIYYLFILLAVVYLIIISTSGHSIYLQHNSRLDHKDYNIAALSLIVPYLLIWLIGFYGYDRLQSYSARIKKSDDGKNIDTIAKGVLMLALFPPLAAILTELTGATFISNEGPKTGYVLINQYFNLVWPFIGFALVSLGARGLTELVNLRASFRALNAIVFSTCVLAVAFSSLITYAYHRNRANFSGPYWLILATMVVPYAFMWFLGMLASYYIYSYRRLSEGVIYRNSWTYLSYGMGGILLMNIVLEFAYTLEAKLSKISFLSYMFFDFVLLILLAAGFTYIAKGATKLKRIEDI